MSDLTWPQDFMDQIIQGDALEVLRQMPDGCINCMVTSPPYLGLRSYGIGAENGEVGLESTPEAYIEHLVQIFREVRRVLRSDGVVALNLGDSYKALDLCLVPFRVALALQSDGWYIRSVLRGARPPACAEDLR